MVYSGPERRTTEAEETELLRFAEALPKRYFEEVVPDNAPRPLRRIEDAALPAHVQGLAQRLHACLERYLDHHFERLQAAGIFTSAWRTDPSMAWLMRLKDTPWLIENLRGVHLQWNPLQTPLECLSADGEGMIELLRLFNRYCISSSNFSGFNTRAVDEFLESQEAWEIQVAPHAWKRTLRVRVDDLLASGLLSTDQVSKFEQLMAGGGAPCFFENVDGLLKRVARGRALILAVEHGVTLGGDSQRELTQLVLAFSRDEHGSAIRRTQQVLPGEEFAAAPWVGVQRQSSTRLGRMQGRRDRSEDLAKLSELLRIDSGRAEGVAQALHENNKGAAVGAWIPEPFYSALEREYRAPPEFITGGVKWHQWGESNIPTGGMDWNRLADALEKSGGNE